MRIAAHVASRRKQQGLFIDIDNEVLGDIATITR